MNNKKKKKGGGGGGEINKKSPSSNAMEIFETFLGKNMWKKSEKLDECITLPIQEAFQNKEFIALYFGAQYSTISTEYTARLVDFYQQANKSAKDNNLEVVYVSSDKTQEEFETHYGSMPWLTMPSETPEEVKVKNDLVKLFKAFRIPCMVILHGPTGRFVTEHGRKHVMDCVTVGKSEESSKEADDNDKTSISKLMVHNVLQQWRDTKLEPVQDAHSMLDYGGGTMSILMYLMKNRIIFVALIAISIFAYTLKSVTNKTVLLLTVFYTVKKLATPSGDQNLPAVPLSPTFAIKAEAEEAKKEK